MESVAWDVLRCMEVVTVGRLGGSSAAGVTLGGAGSGLPVWVEVLTSVLGVPALRHRSGEAASAGAALLAGKALGMGLTLDQLDPVEAVIEPDPAAVELYRGLRPRVDHVAEAVLAATESLPEPRSQRVLSRARRARLRPPRDLGRGARRAREVVVPVEEPALDDEAAAITGALRRPLTGPPLGELVRLRPGARVAVVFPDLTRPMPNRTVLPPLLAELERVGVPDERISLLCATGTHRQATPAEMEELVGPGIVARYRIVDHDADQRRTRAASARWTGPRSCCSASTWRPTCASSPGSSSRTSSPASAAAPRRSARGWPPPRPSWRPTIPAASPTPGPPSSPAPATRCTTSSAPPRRWRRPTCRSTSPSTGTRRVTAVFAGPLPDAHDAACAHVQTSAVRAVDAPFDLVVSTNGGYPLDRNLYQAVKGMAAAERIVRDGGIVVMAAACEDGVPAGGAFARLLGEATTPAATRRGDAAAPSSTAGRPRCSAGCSPGPRSSSTARASSRGAIADALLVPAPDLDGAVASALRRLGPGRGWPCSPRARSRWRRSDPSV